jgi:Holliday junction resolvasome RuvABC endonuclease subunit
MVLSNIVNQRKENRILAIDPSSHSLAWVVFEINKKNNDIKLIKSGKIDYKKIKDVVGKFRTIRSEIKDICEAYLPDTLVIEQSIYVQNFESSRIISYIIGYTWGITDDYCTKITDVNPLIWKNGIGYKNVTKKEIEILSKNGEPGSDQLKAKRERKKRVRDIVAPFFVNDEEGLADDDIIDAAGIGLWYIKKNILIKNG